MRFTAAVALGATLVAAHEHEPPYSTIYSTEVITITSCAPVVTNCPAHSTVTSSIIHTHSFSADLPDYTPQPEPTGSQSECSSHPVPTLDVPVMSLSSAVTESQPHITGGGGPAPTTTPGGDDDDDDNNGQAQCTASVVARTTQITTVVETVIYETLSAACPSSTVPTYPTGGHPTSVRPPLNGTATGHLPTSTPTFVPASAAATNAVSVLAAVAGLFLVLLL